MSETKGHTKRVRSDEKDADSRPSKIVKPISPVELWNDWFETMVHPTPYIDPQPKDDEAKSVRTDDDDDSEEDIGSNDWFATLISCTVCAKYGFRADMMQALSILYRGGELPHYIRVVAIAYRSNKSGILPATTDNETCVDDVCEACHTVFRQQLSLWNESLSIGSHTIRESVDIELAKFISASPLHSIILDYVPSIRVVPLPAKTRGVLSQMSE